MGYCSTAALKEALAPKGQVGSTQTAADLPGGQLTDAIEQAGSIVDVAISGRYATPVASVGDPALTPHPIDYWARDIAAYLATCTFRGSADFSNDDPIYRRYAVTIASLNDIKNGVGTLNLPPASGSSGSAGAADAVNLYSGHLFDAGEFDLTAQTRLAPGRTAWGQDQGWW